VLRARLPGPVRRGRTIAPRGDRAEDLLELGPHDRVALVGARAASQAAARWIVAQLVVRHGPAVVRADLPPAWDWAALLHSPGRRDPPGWHLTVCEAWADGPSQPNEAPSTDQHHAVLVLAERVEQAPAWCTRIVPVCADLTVPVPWAAALAAVVAAAHPDTARASLPTVVPLAGLLGPLDRIEQRWATTPLGLSAPVGVDEHGVVELDLADTGPHALVAGTTGSGKSELLLSWLLGLVVRHSPGDLQLVLVDYKGGATFDSLAGLPHAAGVLTDLDPAATARALASLRAEVRRRERVLAAAGARDLAALRARGLAATGARGTVPTGAHRQLPRLLVVVDEFRELAETHPEVLGALVRLAAQGRALGIHLVLATQRTGGAVGPDVRANLNVRVCLRTLEPADSLEVLGVPDAANLPPVPGRALLRTERLREIQVPWGGADGALPAAVVAAARRGWDRLGHNVAPERPWAAPLPVDVPLTDLPAPSTTWGAPTSALTLPLARSDLPDEQRLGVWAWDGTPILVTGGPGTGRTETLRTVVAQALAAGLAVHVVAARPDQFGDLHGPTLGTVVGADDPRRMSRLLTLLRTAQPARSVLVIDDADVVCDQLDVTGPPGQGAAVLGRVLRDAGRAGLAVAASGPPATVVARWAEPVRSRLVLSPRDETEALLAGVPKELRPVADFPGRAVLLAPGTATAIQIARGGRMCAAGPQGREVLRLAPIPSSVNAAGLPPASPDKVAIGRGGDDAGPVWAPCGPRDRLLVLGPPGSGRTTALATVRAGLAAAGRAIASLPGPGTVPAAEVLVLDDLDRWPASGLDELDRELRGHPAAVVAAATSDAVVAAYRGPLATWRSTAALLVLRPGEAPTQLTVTDLAPAVDPARPLHPGLGVLVVRGSAVPVQVARAASGDDGG
ncbi:FtsK/SpoIIIE domain-containing protein, partial [Georgenia yuyongxinii]